MKIETRVHMKIEGVQQSGSTASDKPTWLLWLRRGWRSSVSGEGVYRSDANLFALPLEDEAEARAYGARVGEWL